MTSLLASVAAAVATNVTALAATQPGSDGGGKLFAADMANANGATWTMESGWTKYGTIGASVGAAIFEHPGDGSEDGDANATRATVITGVAGLLVARLADAGVLTGASVGSDTGLTVTAPAISGLPAGTYYVLHFVLKLATGGATWTAPASATRRTAGGAVCSGTALPYAIGDEVVELPSGGSVGSRTWTQSTALGNTRAAILAIKLPEAPPPVGYDLNWYDGATEVLHELFWYDGATETEYRLTEVAT